MTDDRSFADRNARSQHRLQETIARLAPDDYGIPLGGGWTIGAALAHLAFWDRWAARRWRVWAREGGFRTYADDLVDMVNETGMSEWLALRPDAASALALSSAAEVDAAIAALPPEAVAEALATGREALVDRSRHRTPHLDEIEAARLAVQDMSGID